MTRCPTCYRRVEFLSTHICAATPPLPKTRTYTSQAGYVPPSRRHRMAREDYLAEVMVDPETKKANHRAAQARYRARKKQAA